MKKYYLISLILISSIGCNNPFSSDCAEQIPLNIREVIVPDTAGFFEPTTIKVEVTLADSGYRYVGRYIDYSEDGCTITVMGERETCDYVFCVVTYKWYSFKIRPHRRGEYIIRTKSRHVGAWVDTIFVK